MINVAASLGKLLGTNIFSQIQNFIQKENGILHNNFPDKYNYTTIFHWKIQAFGECPVSPVHLILYMPEPNVSTSATIRIWLNPLG